MRTKTEWEFIRKGRRTEALLQDGHVALIPVAYSGNVREYGMAKSFVFDVMDSGAGVRMGEIALRVGESPSLYYLGHIGYHIDPPFRGHSYALLACRLCVPFLRELHMGSFVITTDDDNQPSIRTCERLGCVLERTVDVPEWCVREFSISRRKRRYVYEMPE